MKIDVQNTLRDPRHKIAADTAAELMAQAEDMDLRRLIATVWRSRYLILILGVVGLTLAYAHLRNVPPLYTSSAKVLWEAAGENVIDIAPVEQSGLRGDFLMRESQVEILLSDRLLGKVVDDVLAAQPSDAEEPIQRKQGWLKYLSFGTIQRGIDAVVGLLGLEDPPPPVVEDTGDRERNRRIGIVRSMLSINWVGNSYVMEIRATTWNPELSEQIANRLAHHYSLDQVEKKYEATRKATDWLSKRVAELRFELEDAEAAVKQFQQDSELVSAQALSVDDRRLKEMRERAGELEARQASLEREIETVESFARGDFDISAASALPRSDLRALAERIVAAQATGSADLDRLIERFRAEASSLVGQRRTELFRAREQRVAVLDTISELEAEIGRKTDALVELLQLEREAEASRLIYESFIARLKETRVQIGSQQPDARLLTPAKAAGGPSWPNKPATLALGLTAGIMLGIMFVILRERLNVTFRTADDLEARTGFPVLGSVPAAPIKKRQMLLGFIQKNPSSSFAEAIRNLRTSILLSSPDKPPQLIVLTSGLPSEGKTTTSIALAYISRSLGKRVLLIEGDLRKQNFRRYFDTDRKYGLLSVLSGHVSFADALYVEPNSGLHVLAGEDSAVNAADVFASRRFGQFLEELREHYDFVVIDTPPVLAVPDARVIAQHADSVVYLVKWNQTLRDTVAQGLRVFQHVNVRVSGLVLSQIDLREMARYGYKDYGYRYKATQKYYS